MRYDAWSTGDREPDWELSSIWSEEKSATGIEIAGDYLFLAYTYPEPSHVSVYQASNGAYVGDLSPNASVDERSGWFDIRYPLRAIQRSNGEYVIFAEEDERAKNLIYRWTP